MKHLLKTITKTLIIAMFFVPFISAKAQETCFSTGNRTDGMNKICYYRCPSGTVAITIQSWQICPVSIRR